LEEGGRLLIEEFRALWKAEKENPEKFWSEQAEKAMEDIYWFKR